MEESCQVGMSAKQRGRRDSHAGRDYPERLCSLQSWRASRPDLTVPRGTWADLIGDTALSKKLAYKLLQVPFKMTFFLRFHNEILSSHLQREEWRKSTSYHSGSHTSAIDLSSLCFYSWKRMLALLPPTCWLPKIPLQLHSECSFISKLQLQLVIAAIGLPTEL